MAENLGGRGVALGGVAWGGMGWGGFQVATMSILNEVVSEYKFIIGSSLSYPKVSW